MRERFRYAICNEIWGGGPLAEACRCARNAGYRGIEIAPFTLAADPARISAAQIREHRAAIEAEGLSFVGLHWLMMAPEGLHVTTSDDAMRARGWEHVRRLVDLCADLGDGGVMVFGSPKQRDTRGEQSPADAVRRFTEGLFGVAPHAEERGVTILVEALPSDQCDVITRLREAAAVVTEIGSPAVRTMFDTHNAADETEPHAALVDRYFDLIRHVHVNEMDGQYPGAGGYDFKPIFEALARRGYSGWISAEVFHFEPGPEEIARRTMACLRADAANKPRGMLR